jgi:predicted MFS family arabinose efflux permease
LALRVAGLLLGADHDPALRSFFLVRLITVAMFATFNAYLGLWAIRRLHASGAQVGLLYAAGAAAWFVCGPLGGALSDRVGRKLPIVAGLAGQALVYLALVPVHDFWLGMGLAILAGIIAAPINPAGDALVADVVAEDAREEAYAGVRVAGNLGAVLGPPIGSLLLVLGSWPALVGGAGCLGLTAAAVAWRVLPNARPRAAEQPMRHAWTALRRDGIFAILVVSTLLAYLVYIGYETALPIVAVTSFGLSPALWGLLLVINPAIVTLFQLRLTRAASSVGAPLRLLVALLLMGVPFLILIAAHGVPAIVVVLLLFVVGEMLWVPTSQAIAVRLAPEALRGAYMGAYSTSASVAWMLGPLSALALRRAYGNDAVWIFFAVVSVVAGLSGAFAARRAD